MDNIVYGFNDIASRMRITVIDFNVWSRLASGVDGCKDVSSVMIVIDVSSMMTVIDNETWLKYSLRRCVDAVIDLRRKNNIVDG